MKNTSFKSAVLKASLFLMILLLPACAPQNYNLPRWSYDWNQAEKAQQDPALLKEGVDQQQAEEGQAALPAEGVEGEMLEGEEGASTLAPQPELPAVHVKVAILLPLSGTQSVLGEAMLQSAQMALFEVAHKGFELAPYDTKGTEEGAFAAATRAQREGARLILGPIFASSARAVKRALSGSDIPVVAFSTDWSITSQNLSTIGFLPFDQMERVISYAASQGMSRIGIIAPETDYGKILVAAYQDVARRYGVQTPKIVTYNPQMADFVTSVRDVSGYDDRMEAAAAIVTQDLGEGANTTGAAFKNRVHQEKRKLALPYEGIFIAAGGQEAITISNLLTQYDAPPSRVRRIGIGLFDDRAIARENAFKGAWFAAPPLTARKDFETRFTTLYGSPPPRLATLSYDATALASILAQQTVYQMRETPDLIDTSRIFTAATIRNPNGFAGVDGIFRILNNGTAERGLAILSFDETGTAVEIDPAPVTFHQGYSH